MQKCVKHGRIASQTCCRSQHAINIHKRRTVICPATVDTSRGKRSASYRQCDQDETRSLTEAQRHWLVSTHTHTHSPRFPSTCLRAPYSTQSTRKQRRSIGNESVLKIIINNTINLFSKTAISNLVIICHNSFRVLFDKIAILIF